MFHPTEVVNGPRREEGHQDDRARSSSGFIVHWSEFFFTWTEPTKNGSVSGYPERLGVCKEGIDARHQRRTPQINRRPSIG